MRPGPSATDFGYRTSKQLGLQVHLVERVDGFVIVGLDLTCVGTVTLAAVWHWRCDHADTVRGSGISKIPSFSWRQQRPPKRWVEGTAALADGSKHGKLTLRDILKSLVGSHDAGERQVRSLGLQALA